MSTPNDGGPATGLTPTSNWITRLFPLNYVEQSSMKNRRDVVVTYVDVELSFLDRIKTLISGRLLVTIKTTTENIVGACETTSGVSVRPPAMIERRQRQ